MSAFENAGATSDPIGERQVWAEAVCDRMYLELVLCAQGKARANVQFRPGCGSERRAPWQNPLAPLLFLVVWFLAVQKSFQRLKVPLSSGFVAILWRGLAPERFIGFLNHRLG